VEGHVAFTFDSQAAELLAAAVGHAERIVDEGDTAIAAGSGDLPVFATPAMIALMEAAACAALAGHLPFDHTSVGVHVDVKHLAPSAIGSAVSAQARILEVSGSRVTFDVSAAHVWGGEQVEIGRGTHVRVVVDRERFLHAI
jgi:predicted thioesterase